MQPRAGARGYQLGLPNKSALKVFEALGASGGKFWDLGLWLWNFGLKCLLGLQVQILILRRETR